MKFIPHQVKAHTRRRTVVPAHIRYRPESNLNTCPIRNAGHKDMQSLRDRRAWIKERKAAKLPIH